MNAESSSGAIVSTTRKMPGVSPGFTRSAFKLKSTTLLAVLAALAFFLTGICASMQAQTVDTWQGTVSTDWSNSLNWLETGSLNLVPDSTTDVVLDLGTGNIAVIFSGSFATGNLTVGNTTTGAANQLTIQGGGNLTSNSAILGNQYESSGTVLVTDPTSHWIVNGSLYVAQSGSANLTIANGGNVTSGSSYVGNSTFGNGTVTVDGAGSKWDTGGNFIFVGFDGNGSVLVSNGGLINSGVVELGYGVAEVGNATVDGANSTWNLNGNAIYVADSGHSTVMVSNGGNLSSGQGVLAFDAGSNATVIVDGANSTWNLGNNSLTVGDGGTGTLTISNGGNVSNGNGTVILGNGTGSNGIVTVDGANSTWTFSGNFEVGGLSTGSLTISNGGNVTSGAADIAPIAANIGSTGNVTVTGANSTWTVGGAFNVGKNDNGTLMITNGGKVVTNGTTYISWSTNGPGAVTVDGTNSTWNLGSNNLFVAGYGNGILTITNGGNVSSGAGEIGYSYFATGSALVDGANSTWNMGSHDLIVSDSGNVALNVSNGGNVSFMNGTVANSGLGIGNINITSGGQLYGNLLNIGASGTGTVVLTGANSTISTGGGGTDYVGGGGTGTLSVSNGGYFFSNGSLTVGSAAGHTGNATFSDVGSNLSVAGYTTVGGSGTGSLSFSNGSTGSTGGLLIGNTIPGVGTVTVSGVSSGGNQTTLEVTSGEIAVGVGNTGTLIVSNGGYIDSTGHSANDTVGLFVGENGGPPSSHGNVTVTGYDPSSGDRSEINVEGGSAAVGYSGNGTLTITNGGNVTLSGNDATFVAGYAGDKANSTGTISIDGANSTLRVAGSDPQYGALVVGNLGIGALNVTNGGNVSITGSLNGGNGLEVGYYAGSNGSVLVDGANSTLSIGGLGYNSMTIGSLGVGNLTITNGGYVNMMTNDGYQSVYVGAGSSGPGSILVDGTGSRWHIDQGMILGGGNGTVTISNGGEVDMGGVLTMAYGATGSGTLNLDNGGTFEIGGTNGIVSGNGTANVNLNGGTLQVIGSDFTTAVNATLGSGNTSTINTNGFNATLSGVLVGAGSLDKQGAGNLTLTNANSFSGNTSISDGNLILGNALALESSTLIYNTGGGSLESGSLASLTLGGLSGNEDIDLDNSTADPLALTVGSNNQSATYTGDLSGNGSLEKVGSGTLTLGGNNTYAGGTNVTGGTLAVTGSLGGALQSSGDFYVGAVVGANFSITNGAAVYADEVSMANVFGDNDTGLVSDHSSLLNANETLDVGEAGTANLTVSNAGNVSVQNINGDDLSVFIGDEASAIGSMTVTGVANVNSTVIKSALFVNSGAVAVGYNGTGSLTVANGGLIYLDGNDTSGIGLYLGYNPASTGNATVTGVEPVSETQTTMEVESGAGVVGNYGNGSLTMTNGGFTGFDGNDTNGIGLYLGDNANSTGSVTVTGVDPVWHIPSNLGVESGAMVVGGQGTGNLTLANGGYADISGSDGSGIGLYIGENANSTGTVTVSDAVYNPDEDYDIQSELDVNSGATVIGYNGTGSLSVTNGGNVDLGGSDGSGVGLYIGSDANSTGNVTVSGTYYDAGDDSYIPSELDVANGATIVGYNGAGNFTVANNGYANLTGNDASGVSLYIGYGANSTGSVTVTDDDVDNYLYSEMDVYNGGVAVGYNGAGNLTVANGAGLYIYGLDTNELGLAIGYNAGVTGNVTVTGAGPDPDFYAEIDVNDGATAVGYNGTGTLTVANGGDMELYGSDDNGVGLYIGDNAGSTGNVTVSDVEPDSENESGLNVNDGSVAVGYNGNGTLTVVNGGYMSTDGYDINGLSMAIGYNAGSTANVTVSGVELNSEDPSELDVESGALAVGYFSAGNLTVANGAYVNAEGSDGNGVSMYLGYDANVTGNVTVTGFEPNSEDQTTLDINEGGLAVGYNGTGNLAITNGGTVDAGGSTELDDVLYYLGAGIGFNANSTGTVTVSDVANINGYDYSSELDVSDGPLVVGYNGTGTLAISNGGYVNAESYSELDDYLYYLGVGIGYNANSNGTVTVSDVANVDGDYIQSRMDVTDAALIVGYNGTGQLAITNGGYVYADSYGYVDNYDGYVGLVAGYQANSTGTVSVSDVANLDGSYFQSELDVDGGALVVGYNGTGNLTVTNGGFVYADSSDDDIGAGMVVGYSANSTGNVTVTGYEPNSEDASNLTVDEGALVVGYNGTGTLTVTDSGYVDVSGTDESGVGLYIGYNAGSTANVTVTGYDPDDPDNIYSQLNVDSGATVVGYLGNGTLTVANGGALGLGGSDENGFGLYLGYDTNSTGTLTMGYWTGFGVDSGATVIGYNGTGILTANSGAYVGSFGSDDNGVSLYLGYGANSTGTVTVSDVANIDAADSPTQLNVDGGGAAIVGYDGNGTLTVANGGNADLETGPGSVGLTLGYDANATGNVTVADVAYFDGNYYQSELSLSGGALAVGYDGTGNLFISNGGYVYADGFDGDGFGMYVGYDAGSNGNVTVTGVEPNSGYQSNLTVDEGALVVGGGGNGTLAISNGGYVELDSSTNGIGLYIGYNAGSTGNVTVSDVEPDSENESGLNVNDGSVAVGYNGNGTLTVVNGGYINTYGDDSNGLSMAIGYNAGSTANVTVSGVADISGNFYQSNLNVNDGALAVGYLSAGNLSISNGASMSSDGSDDNGISMYLGYDANVTGNVTVTGVEPDSEYLTHLDVNDGALVVGYNGTGNLAISNGGRVNTDGEAELDDVLSYLGVGIGFNANSTGTVTVSDVANIDGDPYQSEMDVSGGPLVVGYNGTGQLAITNGGYVYAEGYGFVDNYDGYVGLVAGYEANSTGTVTVSDVANLDGSYFQSELNIDDGPLVVGYNGTGNLTVANGGFVYADSSDNDIGAGVIVGYSANSTGNVTVTGYEPNSGDASNLTVDEAALVVGYNGTGTLTVADSGYVDVSGSDDSGVGLYIGYNANSTANVTVTGFDPDDLDDIYSRLDVDDGDVVVGYLGNGSLTVANGGKVIDSKSGSTLTIGDENTSISSVTVDGANSTLDMSNGSINVGNFGNGTLQITNGGLVTTQYLAAGTWGGAAGSVLVDGANSYLNDSGGMDVGYHTNGSLTVSNGGNLTATYIADGVASGGGNGTVLITGNGSLVTTGSFNLGVSGDGVLTVSNNGLLVVNGGSLTIGSGSSNGTMNLNTGGTVEIDGGGNLLGNGNYVINMQGGAVRNADGPLTLDVNITLIDPIPALNVFDTNGNDLTLSGLLSGNGGLGKAGAGNLYLTQDEVYTGGTGVTGGTLVLDGALGGNLGNATVSSGNLDVSGNNSTLTIVNGSQVYADYVTSAEGNLDNATILVSDLNSLLHANDTVDIANNGTATLTVANGGYTDISGNDGNRVGMYIGYNANATGTVTVTGVEPDSGSYSYLEVGSGALVVGYGGNGSLTLSNGGEADVEYLDVNGIGMSLGYDANATGNVTVTDVANISGDTYGSKLDVYIGALAVGYNGTGNLVIANGGYVYADDSDDNDVGMYVGYNAGSIGNVTVTGLEPNSATPSELEVDYGTFVVGNRGNGTLSVTNGGIVYSDDQYRDSVGLSVGDGANSTGSVTVTGVEPDSGAPSTLNVVYGETVVGNYGNGTLTVANGGYANISGNDDDIIGLSIGYDANATGTVNVSDVGNLEGEAYMSQLGIYGGATIVGYNGTGNLAISNGGSVDQEGADTNGSGMYLGYNANATGTATVSDVANIDGNYYESTLEVNTGGLEVGFNGTGSLLVSNGGYVSLDGSDGFGDGITVGYNLGSTGNVTVTGVEPDSGNASELDVNEGTTVVGGNGNGSLTVSNGGLVLSKGADEYASAYIGAGTGSNGTALVTDPGSIWDVGTDDSYSLVVGYGGTGNLTVANGGNVTAEGYDNDYGAAIFLGVDNGSNGSILVTGTDSMINVPYLGGMGMVIVGLDGMGNLTVANGGNATFSDVGNDGNTTLSIGDQSDGSGSVTVTDFGSSLNVGNGTVVVGNSGNGSLNITNAGYAEFNGTDDNEVGLYLGKGTDADGSVLVSGVVNAGVLDVSSKLILDSGEMMVGYNGTGNLAVTNGGYVDIAGNASDGFALEVAGAAGANGSILVTDVEPDSGYQSSLQVDSGSFAVGSEDNGTLTVANGGYVFAGGLDFNGMGMYIGGDNSGIGNVLVTDTVYNSNLDEYLPSEMDVTFGALAVGYYGVGNLTVANGGKVFVSGEDTDDNSLYLGAESGSNGTLLVTDPGSLLLVEQDDGDSTGAVIIGDAGTGNLTVANGGNATFDTYDNDGTSLALGRSSGGNGTVLVTGANSSLSIIDDEYATVIGGDGNGTFTVANGGYFYDNAYDDNNVAIYLGQNVTGNGTLTVTGDGSSLYNDEGSVVVGDDGTGTMNIANGGSVDISADDGEGLGLVLGGDVGAMGNVTVSDVESVSGNSSTLTVEEGTTVVGGYGNGTLTVANGGYANISGYDDNSVGMYIGYDANTTGCVTVTGVEPNYEYYSDLEVSGGALVVGYDGNGTLTLANGGEAQAEYPDDNGIGLYLGYDTNATGTASVSGVANISGDTYGSELDVYSGALAVGYNGTGNLSITNGGYVYAADSNGYGQGMVIGYNAGSTGNVTVSDIEPDSGYWSELEVDYGALVVGGGGNGTLTVANGGYVLSDDYDGDPVGLSIGDGANSTGSVLVTGIEPTSGHESTLEVDYGAAIVGNYGNGSLTLANAGYANISGYDDNDVGLYIGYDANATGNVTVTDVSNISGNYNESSMQINSGALIVGYNGTGNLTVANGAYVNSESSDANDVSIYLGYNANATGNLTVDGVEAGSEYESDLQVSGGSLVVGGAGYGTLIISNGGYVDAVGSDNNSVGVTIGQLAGATGNVSVVDYEVLGPDTFDSQLSVTDGNLIIGDAGNGTLSVGNGGFVEVDNGYDTVLASQGGSSGTVNLNVGGTFRTSGNISSGAGTATFNLNGGTLQAGGNTSINTNLSLTANSSIDPNGYTVTVSHGINGAGSLSTTGASGTVILNGNSTYPSTTVGVGNLVVNSVLASNVTVNGTGAVLGGNGTINGSVTVNNGGISPGIANTLTGNQASGFANLTINGDLAMNVTATTLVWHLDSSSAASDFLNIQGNLTTGSQSSTIITFDFEHTGYFDGINPTTTYTLLTADNDLQTAGFTFEALNAGPSDYTNSVSSFIFTNGGTTLEFVLVPEPATWGLILGGAMLLLGFIRKRKRRD